MRLSAGGGWREKLTRGLLLLRASGTTVLPLRLLLRDRRPPISACARAGSPLFTHSVSPRPRPRCECAHSSPASTGFFFSRALTFLGPPPTNQPTTTQLVDRKEGRKVGETRSKPPPLPPPQERLPLVRVEWQFFKNMARATTQTWCATRRAIRPTRSEPLAVTRNGPSTAAPTGPGRRFPARIGSARRSFLAYSRLVTPLWQVKGL